MLTLKQLLSSLLVLAITASPVMAGSNDAKTASENTANTATAEATPAAASPSLTSPAGDANVMALLGVLVMKGVLAPNEANAIRNADPKAEFQLLVEALSRKGLLDAADLSAATNPAAQPSAPAASPVAVREAISGSLASPEAESSPEAAAAPQAAQRTPPAAPAVVPAIAPLRVLPVDPPKKDGLNAAFKMGPVKMTPYGFIKATGVYDSSNPNGDDMPFPGLFLSSTSILNTGPTEDPEFHLKARATRFGANLEWPDMSSKIVLTGRIEGDYEGNFSEVDNRDVSSIRSSMFSLRLAWARLDYAASDKTDVYFEGGQDWTLFGSSALPSILETTALGYWYGDVYERSPQFQLGLVQGLGGSRNFKLSPTFAIMMPSTGQIEKLGSLGLQGQIAQAEREGADSGRPEFEGRLALQFQLDKAPGVAPAQIFWSGFRSKRTSIVTNSAYTTTAAYCASNPLICSYQDAFPGGFTTSSKQYGNQIGLQLPTRWFTLVASGYFGGDLRFFFGGQVNTFFTDVGGLSNPVTFTPVDGVVDASGTPQLACTVAVALAVACPTGDVVVAPERPIRAFGGFVNLGLPLSRWFNANPKGHNAGWQLYFDLGKDQVVHKDLFNVNAEGVLPLLMGKMAVATLYYKLNPYVTFGFEQSIYATRLKPGVDYTIAGNLSNEWQDHRTEFGPIFTF
ncbi:MAG: hypothetical protein WBV26_19555 [Candidatus Sulfotelmatobacter sp.]|jgi:hypothetical protein